MDVTRPKVWMLPPTPLVPPSPTPSPSLPLFLPPPLLLLPLPPALVLPGFIELSANRAHGGFWLFVCFCSHLLQIMLSLVLSLSLSAPSFSLSLSLPFSRSLSLSLSLQWRITKDKVEPLTIKKNIALVDFCFVKLFFPSVCSGP